MVQEVLDDDQVTTGVRESGHDLGGVPHGEIVAQGGPGQFEGGLAQVGAAVGDGQPPGLGGALDGRAEEALAAADLEDAQAGLTQREVGDGIEQADGQAVVERPKQGVLQLVAHCRNPLRIVAVVVGLLELALVFDHGERL